MASCTVYIGCPMTGFDKEHMVKMAKEACSIFRKHGLNPWSPVLMEGVNGRGRLGVPTDNDLGGKWEMDKEALDRCFVFVNLRADEKSFGCEDEYGRHRYSSWQPVVRVSPRHCKGYYSIANYQTDLIVPDVETAATLIQALWGTRRQRMLWKLKRWNRSVPKWFLSQLWRLAQ